MSHSKRSWEQADTPLWSLYSHTIMSPFIIYGSTGYTGSLVAEYAAFQGLDFVLAGRDKAKLRTLSTQLNVPYKAFILDDPGTLAHQLQDVPLILNCAGPFAHTAEPLMRACLRTRTHYLDVAAELDSYHLAGELSEDVRKANIMFMPGCGGSVAMLGCLTAFAAEEASSSVVRVEVALLVAGRMSRGSMRSAESAGTIAAGVMSRARGELVQSDDDSAKQEDFDFGDGKGLVNCFAATLPDVVTIWQAIRVPNIRTFVHISGGKFTEGTTDAQDGPTVKEREASPYHAAVVVTCEDGSTKRAVLHTVNGYNFTAQASVEAVKRILAGDCENGFRTPVGVFGSGFVESVSGSVMQRIAPES